MPHANFPGGPSFIVEVPLGQGDGVEREYARLSGIKQVTRLDHFSAFMGRDIYLVWGDMRMSELYISDVINVEGGIQLLYNVFPQIVRPLRPDQVLALGLQHLPVNLQGVINPSRFFHVPVTSSLKEELPLGAPGLSLGPEVSHEIFHQDGGLDRILDLVQAREAWRWNRGEGVVIAVIDSGCAGVPVESREWGWTNLVHGDPWQDDYGHGSMVARIALAVAPKARIASYKPAADERGVMSSSSIYMAADALLGHTLETRTPTVTNNSWGVSGCISVWLPGNVLATRVLKKVDREKIGLLSWAFGNSRHVCGNSRVSGYTLASIPPSLGVGALDRDLKPQFYSSRGPGASFPWQPAVSCPTFGVLPWQEGYRDFGDQGGGTSACAPIVSGAQALLRAAYPEASGRAIRAAIRASASHGQFWDPLTGFGMLQIAAALEREPSAWQHPSYALESLPW